MMLFTNAKLRFEIKTVAFVPITSGYNVHACCRGRTAAIRKTEEH
jgi:hypothetical protein